MIISTFPELYRRDRKRRLPSETAMADLVEGAQAAERLASFTPMGELEVDVRPTTDPNRPMVKGLPKKKGGTGMQMLTGVLGGLSDRISKMTDGPSTPMAPTMISDPVQVERDLSQLTGLPMYYDGGRIRKGQAGVVGDEIVEVDEEGATVIPAERMVSRGARYEELEDAGQTARPDTRALLSQPSGYEQEFGEADPLAQKEAELAEAMKVKPSKWKDFGFSLLSGLNNYLNGAKENRSYSEIKRDRRVAQIAPQVELLRQKKAAIQAEEDRRIKNEKTKAETLYISGRNPAQIETARTRAQLAALSKLAGMQVFDNKNPAHAALAKAAGRSDEEIAEMGTWDFKNPVKATVNGETYQFDRNTGEWNPSNLPKEPMIGLTLTIPGQNPRVFNVPESKAASIASSLQAAGMQIEAAAQRQQAGFQQATNMETLRQQGQQALAKLKSELAENRAMSASERKEKEKQVSELEGLLQAKGEAIPNQ